MATNGSSKQAKISKIEVTQDKISGRGGLVFFLRYVENTRFYSLVQERLGFVKRSKKGLSFFQFLKQLLAYFIDGSDMSMTSFDRRRGDEAYAALLENHPDEMASSHQMKRFFRKFLLVPNWLYRKLLLSLFVWRLLIEKPAVIILFGDTMVLDNDDAKKRKGVEPTYKKKKGYQPLQISWGPYLVDALFRKGSTHSNHGNDFAKAIGRLVQYIRRFYSKTVPIIVVSDSAFLDEKNFRFFEERLKIFYICAGKKYQDIETYLQACPEAAFNALSKDKQFWKFIEFGNRLKSWSRFRRCLFTTLQTDESGQLHLEFTQTDHVIYTNLGQDPELTEQLIEAGQQDYLQPEKIIELDHQRGKGELNHRSLKEFATKEQLPFEQIGMNRAYYYFIVISHFLYEAFKRDVGQDIVPLTCYPNTFRRRLIDFAVKIVSTGGRIVLKVTQNTLDELKLIELWQRIRTPQPILII